MGTSGSADGEDDEVTSAAVRYPYTNDAAALVLVLSMCVLATGLIPPPGELSGQLLTAYSIGFVAAVVWLFGSGVAEKVLGP